VIEVGDTVVRTRTAGRPEFSFVVNEIIGDVYIGTSLNGVRGMILPASDCRLVRKGAKPGARA